MMSAAAGVALRRAGAQLGGVVGIDDDDVGQQDRGLAHRELGIGRAGDEGEATVVGEVGAQQRGDDW